MTTHPLGFLVAAWIAFEDIHPDSGPLVYYPGSHQLPYVLSHNLGIEEDAYKTTGYQSYHDLYEPRIREIIETEKLEPHYSSRKKAKYYSGTPICFMAVLLGAIYPSPARRWSAITSPRE